MVICQLSQLPEAINNAMYFHELWQRLKYMCLALMVWCNRYTKTYNCQLFTDSGLHIRIHTIAIAGITSYSDDIEIQKLILNTKIMKVSIQSITNIAHDNN